MNGLRSIYLIDAIAGVFFFSSYVGIAVWMFTREYYIKRLNECEREIEALKEKTES